MTATVSLSPTQALPLEGQVAVVTGASGGIGRAIALRLAASGADIVIHTRQNLSGAEQTAAEVIRLGRRTRILLSDLANTDNHERLVEQAWEWRQGIQIWVNNAGVDVLTGPWSEAPFEQKLEQLWRVDVVAAIRVSRLVGARMVAAANVDSGGNRVILLIGWDQAEHGMAGDSGEMFAAIKGAVMAFSRSLARSLAPQVRVNCLAPGWIRTKWGAHASQYWQSRAVGESLMKRWGTAEDVAAAADFLASPSAAFITGQIVAVNGGFRGAYGG